MPMEENMAAKAALAAQYQRDASAAAHVYEERPETAASKKFKDAAAKRVRSDSKKLEAPTRTDQLKELAVDVPSEEISWRLIELANDDSYGDIHPTYTFTGATYLYCDKYVDVETAEKLAREPELRAALVKLIRDNAKDAAAPTAADVLMRLSGGLEKAEFDTAMAAISTDETASDIKSVLAFSGLVYYYSDAHLTEEQAAAKARAVELKVKIVVEIRADSKFLAKLTPVAWLDTLAPDTQPGEIEALLEQMMDDPATIDVSVLTAKSGEKFAYSKAYMTEEYATVLLRGESHDAAYIIAETVREAAEVYPRATDVQLFYYPAFGVDRHEIEGAVARALELYEDIKLVPNTGDDVFLYSDRFLTADQAQTTADQQRHGDS